MTISCYEGLPGSGKSYDATRKLLSNLATGRRILTNIDGLQEDRQRTTIQHYYNMDDQQIMDNLVHLDDEQVTNFWEYTQPGDLIVIDEAQNFFNSRDWQSTTNRELGKWASEHRKRGNDVIFISQDMAGIESSVRRLVEWVYRYKKLNMFGSAVQKKYVRFAYYGQSEKPLRKKICTYDQKIFACYSSFFKDGTKELGIEKPVNILRHPIIYAIPVLLIIFVYFFSQSSFVTGDLFGSKAIAQSVSLPEIENPQLETELISGPVDAIEAQPDHSPEPEIIKILGVVNGKQIIKDENGAILLL